MGTASPDPTDALRALDTSKPRPGETHLSRGLKSIGLPLLHLSCCVVISFTIAYVLDGYLAVPAESPRYVDGGKFKLKVSDVTTLVSTGLTIVRLLVGAWAGTIIWNCTFILLEKRPGGLSLPQLSRIMAFNVPPIPRSPSEGLVLLLLLLIIPQQLIAPLITGAVNWSPSFEFSQSLRPTQAGSPEANPTSWFWYYYAGADRRASVRRAAAMATMAWDGSATDRAHSRHVMNDVRGVSIPINSTLFNAVVPCIRAHSITFPTAPPPEKVLKIAKDSVHDQEESETLLTRVGEAPLRYGVNGNAVLFDPDDRPGTHDALPPKYDSAFVMERPADYKKSGIIIFGKTPNNIFNTTDGGNYDWCHTYAIVNLTAGIAQSPTSTYVSDRVVEADLPSTELDLKGGPWVKEAMYLMPDVMSNVAMMHSTKLYTWDDIERYLDKLIRYSYQGAWDMLYRSYEPDNRTLDVRYYEPRVLASVSKARVFAWLALSLLLTLSAVVLVTGNKASCERSIVFDGPVAALVTDAREVLEKGGVGLTNLAYVTKEKKVGKVQLRRNPGSGFYLASSHME
ncbi:hypothetical protein B0O99DRAFT_656735 [Bisporella sp. PMI_857]|nr:hypothetical protein B0O99DRAFT_656735 [Bisporella sp. PMI_857]